MSAQQENLINQRMDAELIRSSRKARDTHVFFYFDKKVH